MNNICKLFLSTDVPGLILAEGPRQQWPTQAEMEELLWEGGKQDGNPKVLFTPGNYKERWTLVPGEMHLTPFDLCAAAGEQRNK